MAATPLYAHAAGDWDAVDAWNDAQNGLGTHYTNPQNGTPPGVTYICILNSLAMHANLDITVDAIQAPAGDTGTLTIEGTRVINVGATDGIVYTHTSTSGMIIVPTGTNLTINGQIVCAAAGYVVVTAGTAVISIVNAGGTAISVTGTGRGISSGGGNFSVTGIINCSNTGYAVYNASASTGHSFDGNFIMGANSMYGIRMTAGTVTWTPQAGTASVAQAGGTAGMYLSGGALVVDALIYTTNVVGFATPILIAGGTMTYIGDFTLADGQNCEITVTSGTLHLATVANNLVLTNSGTFVVRNMAGTINTADAGAGAASIINQSATSYAAIIGGTAANKARIIGPTLPAKEDVETASGLYGYAGALLTPEFNVPAVTDVKDGVFYGADNEFEGSYAGGGGSVIVIED
jgi:hypothetical protein